MRKLVNQKNDYQTTERSGGSADTSAGRVLRTAEVLRRGLQYGLRQVSTSDPRKGSLRTWGAAVLAVTLLLSGCVGIDPQTPQTPEAAQTPQPSADAAEQLSTISLGNILFTPFLQVTQDGMAVTIEQDDAGTWSVAELVSDDTIPGQFVDSLSRLKGTEADLPSAAKELFTITADQVELEFTNARGLTYLTQDGTTYEVNSISPFLAEFDLLTLVTAQRLDINPATMTSLQVRDQDNVLLNLSTETDLSEAEQYALLSGWYLHDHYNRSYATEVGRNNELLAITGGMKLLSPALEEPAGSHYLRTVEVGFPDNTVEFEIHLLDADQYYLRTSAGYFYEISPGQALPYLASPFSLVSKLLAVIPANYLESVTVTAGSQEYSAVATSQDDAGRPVFEVNGDEVDQAEFRRAYQYVAAIAGVREYQGEAYRQEAAATIAYHFDADGTAATRTVELYELIDDPASLVAFEAGSGDFIVDRVMLDAALDQLNTL